MTMKERFLKILQTLKRPSGRLLAAIYFLTVVFCGVAIWLAVLQSENMVLQIFSYVAYALAAITLGYGVYSIIVYAPTLKTRTVAWIKKFPLGKSLLERYDFRTIVFSAFSLVLNLAYVVMHIVLAFVTRAYFWYGSLAAYYGMLVALRSGIVLYQRKKGKTESADAYLQAKTEIGKYRTCGVLLTIIPLCLTIPILQVFYLDRAFVHEGMVTVIAFAAYAFYKIIMAILGAISAQKQPDVTVRAVRNVSLADAMVSIFSLQTALLYAFSEGNYTVANALTGSAVCLLTMALGVWMIVRSFKMKKQLEENIEKGA